MGIKAISRVIEAISSIAVVALLREGDPKVVPGFLLIALFFFSAAANGKCVYLY